MNLFYGFSIAILEKVLKQVRDIIVVYVYGSILIVLDFSEINGVSVVNILQYVDFLLKNRMLFLAFVINSFFNQNLFQLSLVIADLAKWKLAAFHVNYVISFHFSGKV